MQQKQLGVWERAISMHRSSWAYVLEPRPRGRSVSWLGYDSPHGSAFLPFFGAGGEAPESFRSHEGYMSKFSTKVAWWAFNLINQYTDLNYKLINAEVRQHSKNIEDEGEQKLVECNAAADRVEADGAEAVSSALATCGNAFAEAKVEEWWALAWALVAKYRGYSITANESAGGSPGQQYPDWWVKSVEVGYTMWGMRGPFHGIVIEDDSSTHFSSLGPDAARWVIVLVGMATMTGVFGYSLGKRRGQRSIQVPEGGYIVAP